MRDIGKFIKEIVWSPSSILQILNCQRKFYLDRIFKLITAAPWYFPFGEASHKSTEALHIGSGANRGKFQPSPDRPFFFKSKESFASFWNWRWRKSVEEYKKRYGEVTWLYQGQYWKLKKLGKELLTGSPDNTGYWDRFLSLPASLGLGSIEILEVEYTIPTIKLFGKYPFTGRIDQLWHLPDSEMLAIVDLTTSRLENVKLFQVSSYIEGLETAISENHEVEKRFGNLPIIGIVWSLASDKLRKLESYDRSRLRAQLETAYSHLLEQKWTPTDDDHSCKYCRFNSTCRGEPFETIELANEKEGKPAPTLNPTEQKEEQEAPAQLKLPHNKEDGGWFRGWKVRGDEPPKTG